MSLKFEPLIVYLMLFLLHLIAASTAQSASCFPMPANTVCGPAFEGYLLDKTIAEFNSNMSNNVLNATSVASTLVEEGICSPNFVFTAIQLFRYQISMQCGVAVMLSSQNGCPIPSNLLAKGPLLCPSQCNLAISSQASVLHNQTVCPKGDLIFTKSFTDYCSFVTTNYPNPQSTCFASAPSDSNLCGIYSSYLGFSDNATALTQCATLPNDTCCQTFLKNNSTSPSSTSSKSTVVIISAIAAVVIVVFIIAGIFICIKRKSGHQKSEVVTAEVLPKDGTQKSYFPDSSPKFERDSTLFGQRTSFVSERSSIVSVGPLVPPGAKRMNIVHPYEATLQDELKLVPGSFIYLIRAFDDGWALGMDPKSGHQGAFPMVW